MSREDQIAALTALLRESEARRRLVEDQAQATWETDPAGIVVADSPSWRAYTGQTLDEWLGYGWLDAIHPDDRAYAERQWREAVAVRGLVNAEFRLRSTDGGWRWTNVRAAPVCAEDGAVAKWSGMNIDIDARKRAEAALIDSEAKYRTVCDAIDEGFLIHEIIRDANGQPVDLRMLEANPALTRLTGLSQDLVGKRQRAIMPGLEQIWLDTFDRVARTGASERLENYNQPTARWYSVHISKVAGYDDRVAVVYDDVTGRKRSEIALRKSEERQAFLLRLSDALRAAPTASEKIETAARLLGEHLHASRILWAEYDWERKLAHIFGGWFAAGARSFPTVMQLDEYAGDVLDDLRAGTTVRVDDIGALVDRPAYAAIADVGVQALLSVPLISNGILKVNISVHQQEPRHWSDEEVDLVRDVAERLWAEVVRARAEIALRDSEERFRHFADASASGLWFRDAATLSMEYVSPAVGVIYGLDPGALLGEVHRWASQIVPDDRDEALRHLEEARQGRSVVHEFRIQRPSDGAFRWIRNTDFPLRDDGQVTRIGGIAEDITEVRLAVEHQGVLLAELQHRVRNIMAIIRSIVARTAERAKGVDDYATLLSGRLLALARVQALLTRAADVRVGVAAVVRDEVSAQAQHEGQYVLEGPEIVLSPKAAEVLTLAVHELATNALKYGALSAARGRVTVRWDTIERRGTEWLVFDWTEEGAPERPPATPDAPRRIGFGSELIEGRVPYELKGKGSLSIEPGGARCHLEFPVREGASVLETGAPRQTIVYGGALDMAGETDLGGRAILVVEDDYYIATDTARALKGAGARVLGPCATEEQALAEIEDEAPAAAVVDINLGAGPSFGLARWLAERGVPFVFVTGYDEEVIPAEFAAVPRLQKPVDLRRIVAAVANMVGAAA